MLTCQTVRAQQQLNPNSEKSLKSRSETDRDGVGPLQLGRRSADALCGGRGAAGQGHLDVFWVCLCERSDGGVRSLVPAVAVRRAQSFSSQVISFYGVICLRLLTSRTLISLSSINAHQTHPTLAQTALKIYVYMSLWLCVCVCMCA